MAKRKYYEVRIDETARSSPKSRDSEIFNQEKVTFETKSEAKNYLLERYGKIPNRNKIYIDNVKSGKSEEVGFAHSFWNRDISHNSKNWFQTDWVSVKEVEKMEKPVRFD